MPLSHASDRPAEVELHLMWKTKSYQTLRVTSFVPPLYGSLNHEVYWPPSIVDPPWPRMRMPRPPGIVSMLKFGKPLLAL